MNFARFAGFKHETDLSARAFANEMMMNACYRQQRWNRRPFFIDATVGKHNDVVALFYSLIDFLAEVIHGLLQTGRAVGGFEKNRQTH